MPGKQNFIKRVENKIHEQLSSRNVAYLLGAGSSYLGGKGYPLAGHLWQDIKDSIKEPQRSEIQAKLDGGADGLEQALDLLDHGGVDDTLHRHLVKDAIAEHFVKLNAPLDQHVFFLRKLTARQEPHISIFNLNYDPLIERAAEETRIRVIDGFVGIENAYFDPDCLSQSIGRVLRTGRHYKFQPSRGIIKLFKLHGSLGWFESKEKGIRRFAFSTESPLTMERLMIPPQHRKATDTMTRPYATMWSEFRSMLGHGPELINRLVCIGYGMRDEHVNAVIENGLGRRDFTLLIFAQLLLPDVFTRWAKHSNVVVVTSDMCSLYGELGEGHPELWDFQQVCEEA